MTGVVTVATGLRRETVYVGLDNGADKQGQPELESRLEATSFRLITVRVYYTDWTGEAGKKVWRSCNTQPLKDRQVLAGPDDVSSKRSKDELVSSQGSRRHAKALESRY